MTDYTGSLIARAIKFLGLCLFYGLTMKYSSNQQKAVDAIESEYHKP